MKKGKNGRRNSLTCRLGIRCSPLIQDPSEFTTILLSSTRSLFGELECHTSNVEISKVPDALNRDYQFILECDKESVNAIQASLTMATPPPYLLSTTYRFDTIMIDE
mmetsp:Transcript_85506/g.173463  ORF Transcript_85506/g.173463 Transcript_85506/m.173463 type:complete len:107 (+) Transcript_85506:148-468(+)